MVDTMKGSHVKQLETRINNLARAFKRLNIVEDLEALIPIIKRPGWTTPAEFVFALGIVDSLVTQVEVVSDLTQTLVKGSREVGV